MRLSPGRESDPHRTYQVCPDIGAGDKRSSPWSHSRHINIFIIDHLRGTTSTSTWLDFILNLHVRALSGIHLQVESENKILISILSLVVAKFKFQVSRCAIATVTVTADRVGLCNTYWWIWKQLNHPIVKKKIKEQVSTRILNILDGIFTYKYPGCQTCCFV